MAGGARGGRRNGHPPLGGFCVTDPDPPSGNSRRPPGNSTQGNPGIFALSGATPPRGDGTQGGHGLFELSGGASHPEHASTSGEVFSLSGGGVPLNPPSKGGGLFALSTGVAAHAASLGSSKVEDATGLRASATNSREVSARSSGVPYPVLGEAGDASTSGRGSAPARRGCERCGSLSFCEDWWASLGVALCPRCKSAESLVTKSNAKALFLVTDGDLAKLRSIRKPNPRHKEWGGMKLYLQSQVEAVACQKHGGAAGIEERRHALMTSRIQGRAKRKEASGKKEEEAAAKIRRVRERMEMDAKSKRESAACATDVVDEGTGGVVRQFGDGAEVEVEDI